MYIALMRLLLVILLAATTAQAQFEIEESHTKASLRGIHSLRGGVAWASGSDGTVLRTKDGGHLWQTCAIPPGAEKLDFRGIQGFDANTAIVMSSGKGDLSRLYKTTNGCQSWKLIFTNPDKDGFWDAVRFIGSSGWLLGDPVRGSFALFESLDDGRHWTRQRNPGLRVETNTESVFAASNSALFERAGLVMFGTGGKGGSYVFKVVSIILCKRSG